MTTDIIVNQKNAPGHSDESVIPSATVTMNTSTSIRMLQTILGVKLPLQHKKCQSQQNRVTLQSANTYPKFKNIFNQLNTTFGICDANPK